MPANYIVNITIESFLIAIILVFAALLSAENAEISLGGGKVRKSDKILLAMFYVNAIGLAVDVASYFADGKSDLIYVYLNKTLIFLSFLYGPVLIYIFADYIYSKMREEGAEPTKLSSFTTVLPVIADLAILTMTQFTLYTGDMGYYFFDTGNKYTHGSLYFLHYLLSAVVFAVCTGELIIAHKKLRKNTFYTIAGANFVIALSLVLQVMVTSITFIHIGNAAAIVIFFTGYMKEKNDRYIETRDKMNQMRNALLLSQIQPHFVFNALSVIQTLISKDPDTARKAVGYFSDFLRGTIDSLESDSLVTFKDDMKTAMGYLEIEKLRFGDSIRISTDIKEDSFKLPALSIQPLVENAVKHGLRKSMNNVGNLIIATDKRDDHFYIRIIDDGVGFDPEEKKDDGRTHVGLRNVKERIETEVNGEFIIDSRKGEGTKITIKIPDPEAVRK